MCVANSKNAKRKIITITEIKEVNESKTVVKYILLGDNKTIFSRAIVVSKSRVINTHNFSC